MHDGLSGAAIPVRSIRAIAFAAVQIRVHPGAVGAFDVLGNLVRAVPVAAARVPQRVEGVRQAGRRRGVRERPLK